MTGLCECGCGEVTALARQTHTVEGTIKGQPRRFLKGHNRRRSPNDYEVTESGCWEWARAVHSNGYGKAWDGSQVREAHRVYYERFKGPIPDGLHVDHLCSNRTCVNPEHLEAVTVGENNRRSHARGRYKKVLL